MSMERKRKFRSRFDKMDDAAIRKWLANAEHSLQRMREHVNAARHVLAKRECTGAQRAKEHTHG